MSCRGAASFQPQVEKFRLYLTAAALTVTACMRRQQCPVCGAGAGDRAWHACGEAPDRRARQHEKLVSCELIRLGGRAVRASKIGRPCRDPGCCPDDVGSPAGGEGRCCTCITEHLTSLRGLRSGRSGCNFTAFGGLRARLATTCRNLAPFLDGKKVRTKALHLMFLKSKIWKSFRN